MDPRKRDIRLYVCAHFNDQLIVGKPEAVRQLKRWITDVMVMGGPKRPEAEVEDGREAFLRGKESLERGGDQFSFSV